MLNVFQDLGNVYELIIGSECCCSQNGPGKVGQARRFCDTFYWTNCGLGRAVGQAFRY